MTQPLQTVKSFLDNWKPFAEMGAGNPAKRGINRFLEASDEAHRRDVLGRSNTLFQMYGFYTKLGIRGDGQKEKEERFNSLLNMPLEEMARLVNEDPKALLLLLQEGFEFGRFTPDTQLQVVRQFLLAFWAQDIDGQALKYSIFANGIMYAAPGISHDEMSIRFAKLGLGTSRPIGGGQMRRRGVLEFEYDTSSSAFGIHLKPPFVASSLRRWVRSTGGMDDRVKINYEKKLGAL